MWLKIKALLLRNTTVRQTVFKNTFWLFFGQIISRLIRAAIIIYAARVLGAESWGAFAYALSIAATFTIFTDFGISGLLTREASRDLSKQEQYFSTALAIKLGMLILIAVPVVIFSPYFITKKEVAVLMPFVVAIIGFDTLRDFGTILSRAWEKMEIEAAVQIITNVIVVAVGFAALYYSKTAKSLAWGYAIGTGLGMIAAFYPFRQYLKNFRKKFSAKLIKPMLAASWPFGVSGLLGVLLLNTDNVLIGWILDIKNVGYYSAGQRIVQLGYIVPVLFAAAFFPSMSKFAEDKERFRGMVERATTLLSMLAIPMTIGGIIFGKEIVQLLYGSAYNPAILSFQIMSLAYLPWFVGVVLGNGLFALRYEKKILIYSFVGFFGNLFMDLWLIPGWGIAGSAIATVANQILVTTLLMWKMKKTVNAQWLRHLKKIFVASLAMAAFCGLLKLWGANIYIAVPSAAAFYFGLLILAKEKTVFELTTIFQKPVPESPQVS